MTEIEAKVKYVKLARSLRTYGVSFFLVKVRCQSKAAPAYSIKKIKWRKEITPKVLFESFYIKGEKQILELVEMKLEPFISKA